MCLSPVGAGQNTLSVFSQEGEEDPKHLMLAALLLAGKVEECAVRAEDVVSVVRSLLQRHIERAREQICAKHT